MLPSHNPAIHETEYIWDDKRKIVINARNLTDFQFDLYKRSMFKRLRPDLSELDFQAWNVRYRAGERYLNELKRKLNLEMKRAAMTTRLGGYKLTNEVKKN